MAQQLRPQAETLSGSPQPNFVGYSVAPIIAKRDPTSADTGYPLGQFWDNKSSNNLWCLLSVSAGSANWAEISLGAAGPLDKLQGSSGTALPSGGAITIAGTINEITTTASGSTVTLTIPSTFTAPGTITATSGAITATNGNVVLGTAGNKLSIATGSNASIGSSALTAGTVTVSTTAVTASSKIFLTNGIAGGTLGDLSVGTITAGTSFVINSSSASDTSTVNWLIIN